MLKISQKTEYAMRAMVELAIRRSADPEGLVPARSLAEAQGIPLRFLEQQLGTLHKAGLVESFRGAGGGCRLARDAADVRVADVVDAIEGPLYPMNCMGDHSCFQDSRCGLQGLWGDVHVAIRQVFERTTLADLAQRHRRLVERHGVVAEPVLWAPDELIKPRG
jgi:Rrf2 family transcriptional regulator, cysteine metabolism repressor